MLQAKLPRRPHAAGSLVGFPHCDPRCEDQIQDETGCKIIISGRDDYFPGTHFRILVILGEAPDAMLGVFTHLIPDTSDFAKKERSPSGAVPHGPTCRSFVHRMSTFSAIYGDFKFSRIFKR